MSLLVAWAYFGWASHASTQPLGLILLVMAGLLGLRWLIGSIDVSPIHLPLGLFWGIATLAMILSPVTYVAVEGWIKLTIYVLGAFFLHQLLVQRQYRSWVVGGVLLVSLWMSIYGLRQYFYGAEDLATWVDPQSGLTGVTRVYSYLDNPNLYGGYLVAVIPLGLAAVWIWQSWGCKVLALGITGMNLLCLMLTLSRGAWIGALVALVSVGIPLIQWIRVSVPTRWRRWTIPMVLAGIAGFVLAGVVAIGPEQVQGIVETLSLRFQSYFAGRADSSNNFRINVWLSVLEMIRDFPILGIGPGNGAFNRVYPLYQRSNYSALGAYSVPLEIMVETGIVGITAFLWLVIVLVGQGIRGWRLALDRLDLEGLWLAAGLAMCLGLMGHGLVDTVWYRPQIQMLWWLGVGLISGYLSSQVIHQDSFDHADHDSIQLSEPLKISSSSKGA